MTAAKVTAEMTVTEVVTGGMTEETTEGTMNVVMNREDTEVEETGEMTVTTDGEMEAMEMIVLAAEVGTAMTAQVVAGMEVGMKGERNTEIDVKEMTARVVVVVGMEMTDLVVAAVDMEMTDPVEVAMAMTALVGVDMVEMITVPAEAMGAATQMTVDMIKPPLEAAVTMAAITMTRLNVTMTMIPAETREVMEETKVVNTPLALPTVEAVMADQVTSPAHNSMPNLAQETPETPTCSAPLSAFSLARNPRSRRKTLMKMMRSSSTRSSTAVERITDNPTRTTSVLPLPCRH